MGLVNKILKYNTSDKWYKVNLN